MKAAIYKGIGKIEVEERPIPTLSNPSDAVVRVVRSCVCGSDLWFYRGLREHPVGPIGHEMIGVVEARGADVKTLNVGDFVIAPFAFSDGTCPNCTHGFHTACMNGGFFGGGEEGMGCQAEYVRVPHADGTLVVVPGTDFSDEDLASLLALADVMGTGYHAAVSALVKAGDTVAVVGDGAVGLAGVLSRPRRHHSKRCHEFRCSCSHYYLKLLSARDITPMNSLDATSLKHSLRLIHSNTSKGASGGPDL
ncbi:MAG: alcohol dehydrogenase catalytic domain-containing protein [Fimbriimonadaceae bacterium]|nr:alcohol dehydrogenase catalytic domain-containing protein [Fimbriimonadaceae bacterium]